MVSGPWSRQVKNTDNHYGMKVYVDGESCILTKHIVDPAPAVVHRQVAYSWALCKWQNLCILWPPIESLKFTYYYFPIFKLQPVNSNTLLRHLHSLTAITEINQNQINCIHTHKLQRKIRYTDFLVTKAQKCLFRCNSCQSRYHRPYKVKHLYAPYLDSVYVKTTKESYGFQQPYTETDNRYNSAQAIWSYG